MMLTDYVSMILPSVLTQIVAGYAITTTYDEVMCTIIANHEKIPALRRYVKGGAVLNTAKVKRLISDHFGDRKINGEKVGFSYAHYVAQHCWCSWDYHGYDSYTPLITCDYHLQSGKKRVKVIIPEWLEKIDDNQLHILALIMSGCSLL